MGISPGLRAVVCSAGEHAAPAELKCISSVQLLSQEGKLYIGLRDRRAHAVPFPKKEKTIIYIYIYTVFHKSEYTPHISAINLVYIFKEQYYRN